MGVIVNRRLGVTHCLLDDLKNIRVRGPSAEAKSHAPRRILGALASVHGFERLMRFYEYESKALFARHGLPLGDSDVARSADHARDIAHRIGRPVVLKSQVLSGGRMKAGAVKFADTPDEAAQLYEEIMPILVSGQKARSILVEEKSPIAQEYYAGITWDGRRKLPVLIFSDMGGIDIEEVAEEHPEHVSKTHF